MACSFNLDFRGSASTIVAAAKSKVEGNGGTFNGTDTSGVFSVPILGSRVDGAYFITNQQMRVDVSRKPFLISCRQIERFLAAHTG